MSWEDIDTTRPKSRKARSCVWCPEKIEAKTVYVKQIGKFEGDFQSNCYHPECYTAAHHELCGSEDGFMPHSFVRGTGREA